MKNELHSLPRWIAFFLRTICPEELYEEIEGDLIQKFGKDISKVGRTRAYWKLFVNAVRFCRPGILLRNRYSLRIIEGGMLRAYLMIAGRHLIKNKTFSIINISGLAIGMVAFFLIVRYVSFEMSYDDFHINKDQIYRIALERHKNNELQEALAENFVGLSDVLRKDFPEVEAHTLLYKTPANTGVMFQYGGRIYNELGGEINADSGFFKVFPTLLAKGDPQTALSKPHDMVLSESMAKKLFGDADPIGQHLQRPDNDQNFLDCVVTGVMKDIPVNAHFHANFIMPLVLEPSANSNEWKGNFIHTYVALKSGVSPDHLSERLDAIYRRVGKNHAEVRGAKSIWQPITSIHLSSNLKGELEPNGSKSLVYGMCAIAVVILIIAWINYINLETSRFVKRAREVGVRRIIGSAKRDLAMQFLVEYFFILMIAAVAATGILFFVIPKFSFLTGIPMEALMWSPEVWLVALCFVAAGSVLVGIYPALFLFRFNPVAALKGNFSNSVRGNSVRKSLVVVQFSVSFIMIAFLLVVREQLAFMENADRQFDSDQVIAIRNPTAYSAEEVATKRNHYERFTAKLSQLAPVSLVTSSSAIPGTEIGFTYVNLLKRNVSDPYDPTVYKTLFVDYNYIPLYDLKLLAGRNFEVPPSGDQWKQPWLDEHWRSIILNEQAVHALGFKSPENAVDQIVEFHNFGDDFEKHRIIGVVADYHHEAVKRPVLPMILSPNYGCFQQVYYSVRLQPGTNPFDARAQVEKAWKETFPEKPFDYFFLNDYYNQQFRSEVLFQKIFTAFSVIAIFIASLGVLGLAVFEANIRLKEISIRKVLGASVFSIVRLLSREHVRAILISCAVGIPVLYFTATQWLAYYPLRITLSPLVVLLPTVIIVAMVMLTAGIQTMRSANTNPVDHLKND